MYLKVLEVANWVIVALLCVSALLLLYKIFFHIYGLFPAKKFKQAKSQHKFAILVPARNESNVINSLLKSFSNCDYPKELFDIYVIVESEKDPTVEICKNYKNVVSFVRPNLDIKTKGGALDQIIKHLVNDGIAEQKGYDAYFVFDADNVIAPNFLSEMNKAFDEGYEFCLGYRNSKNWNDGWIASCSALTFSMINTFQNKCRARFTQNILVSGTGFYMSSRIINNLAGWPFYTLAEDVEISNYAVMHNIKATYNEYAEYFDEQPTNLKTSWNQRLRWVKGYSQVHKKYHKEMFKSALFSRENRICKFEFSINIIPMLVPIASVFLYIVFMLVLGFVGLGLKVPAVEYQTAFINFGFACLGLYSFFFLYTMALLLAERKHINITFFNGVITCFMNPFFLAIYIPIFINSLFKKEVKWTQINHVTN